MFNGVKARGGGWVWQEAQAKCLSSSSGGFASVDWSIVFHNPGQTIATPNSLDTLPGIKQVLLSDLGQVDLAINTCPVSGCAQNMLSPLRLEVDWDTSNMIRGERPPSQMAPQTGREEMPDLTSAQQTCLLT